MQPEPLKHPIAFPDENALRAQFPYLQEQLKGQVIAYLDSAASAQKPVRVIERMVHFLQREYANVHRGAHLLSERATDAYEKSREALQMFLGAARVEEIIFTSGTTAAVNLVARAWGDQMVRAGDTLVLTEAEHHSNLLPWQELAARKGARVVYIPVHHRGEGLDLQAAKQLLAEKPRLLALAHVSNTMGYENPVAELCRLARAGETYTFVDAAQSVGHQPVNVQDIGCDFLACSAHKMMGPTGIGLLYGRYEHLVQMPPWQFGGEMVERSDFARPAIYRQPPARFEAGTPPILEAVGWHEALGFLTTVGLDRIQRHSIQLAQLAYDELQALDGITCFGPARREAGMVTFAAQGIHAHDLAFFCNERGVAVRAGHHCAQPLMRKLEVPSSTRASFYLYNTEEEVARLVSAVKEAIRFFRG